MHDSFVNKSKVVISQFVNCSLYRCGHFCTFCLFIAPKIGFPFKIGSKRKCSHFLPMDSEKGFSNFNLQIDKGHDRFS